MVEIGGPGLAPEEAAPVVPLEDGAFRVINELRAPGVKEAAVGLKERAVAFILNVGLGAFELDSASFLGARFRLDMSSGRGVLSRNDCAHALRSVNRFCFSFCASSALRTTRRSRSALTNWRKSAVRALLPCEVGAESGAFLEVLAGDVALPVTSRDGVAM